VGSDNFPKIKFWIILTWQPVFMISQVWARLEYHLRISRSAIFVISNKNISDRGKKPSKQIP